ncbi:MAG TPA: hypothetical protein VG013_17570 [Gemmataceae bacterium]|jgi:hypothetical protein|nr:hypothetical protein [Gemmataceae bacterium]
MRSGKRLGLVVVVCGCALLTCGAASARAENKIDEKLATILGKDVVLAAHPSAQDPALLEYREKETPKDGRLMLHIKMKYFGKATSTKYLANITITIDTSKDTLRVLDLDYKDDNKIPSSKKKLKAVENELTKKLPKQI